MHQDNKLKDNELISIFVSCARYQIVIVRRKRSKNDEETYSIVSLHRDNHRTRPNYRWKEEIFVRVRERWRKDEESYAEENIRRELRFLLLSANFCPTDFQLYKQ